MILNIQMRSKSTGKLQEGFAYLGGYGTQAKPVLVIAGGVVKAPSPWTVVRVPVGTEGEYLLELLEAGFAVAWWPDEPKEEV